MVELFLMASHGAYPPTFFPDQGLNKISKDFHHILPCHAANQDMVNSHHFNQSLPLKEEWNCTGALLNYDRFAKIDSMAKGPPHINAQDSVPFSFGIAERCTRQERILKFLASGSIETEEDLPDLSMLCDMMGPQPLIADLSQQAFLSYSRWCCTEIDPQQSLVYPTSEFYFNEPLLDLAGDRNGFIENMNYPDSQMQYNGTEMHDVLSVISEFYLSKTTVRSSKQTMLVPYFERRRRARANTNALKFATEKEGSLKSHEKVKEKASHKKKNNIRTVRGRDVNSNSYLHACESLLSIIVDRNQQGTNAIHSVKKSGPQLPHLLTQFSATIAGTGIAVVFSVILRVACGRMPLCASKLLSTGLGLGLVWFSWAVNKLRDTVICINKTPAKLGEREEEMMNHLDGNLKVIYFRAVALMAVVVLKLA